MYRSSKLNEQRVNILRNDEDSFDHIAELKSIGKDSISNYLPPIYLTEIVRNFNFYSNNNLHIRK